ncbi:MAG TPA: dolichyl-phosphate beta-glucosyltransferase [Candidatus Binatia bacterium]|nr:dolichyl-phosphate beta-glucosyltransferase [Candidatus Binatia bacterium]
MSQPTHSIVIPAYNESERLASSIPKVLQYIHERGLHAEIVVLNDGSRDATAEVVRKFAASDASILLLENPGNRGKGYSIRNGMLHARAAVALFTDADLSSPITEADKLFAAIEDGADIAIGSRWLQRELQTERQPLLRQLFGRLFNIGLRLMLGLKYKDTQCGFKAFNRRAIETVFTRQQIERWGFDPELLFLADKFGLRTAEVPVEWAHDHRSKINPLRDGLKMGAEMLKIRWNWLLGRYRKPSKEARLVQQSDRACNPNNLQNSIGGLPGQISSSNIFCPSHGPELQEFLQLRRAPSILS